MVFGTFGTLVALGQQNGTFAEPIFALDDFRTNQGRSTQNSLMRELGDFNGDGFADIFGFGSEGLVISTAFESLIL